MTDIKRLNKLLADTFGRHIDGRQKWLLSWSEDLYEHRHGNFEDWYGGVFVRAFTGVRYARKYTMTHNRWILERLVFEPNQIIKGSENGHYEYIKAFSTDKDGKPIKPSWNILEFLIKLILFGTKATASDYKTMDEADRNRFIEEATDILSNEVPFLAGKLADGSAIVSPGVPE